MKIFVLIESPESSLPSERIWGVGYFCFIFLELELQTPTSFTYSSYVQVQTGSSAVPLLANYFSKDLRLTYLECY